MVSIVWIRRKLYQRCADRKKGVITSLPDIVMRPSCCLDQVEKHKKGGGVQGLGLKPLHPCFKIKRATDKGLNAAVWFNAGFCRSHSDCCISQWSVTKWAITPVGLAIYYWYESQTTRRRQWFMLKHFNPNWYFDIFWPSCRIFCNQFWSCPPLLRPSSS